MPFQKKLANNQINPTNGELIQNSNSNEEYVEVICDGTRTYREMLTELISKADINKITPRSVLIDGVYVMQLMYIEKPYNSVTYATSMSTVGGTIRFNTRTIDLNFNPSVDNHYIVLSVLNGSATRDDLSSNVPASNRILRLYY